MEPVLRAARPGIALPEIAFALLVAFALALASACSFGGGGGGGDDDTDAADDDAMDDDDSSGDDSGDDSSDDDDVTDDDATDDDSGDDDDDSGDANLWGNVYLSEGLASSNYTALTYYNYASAVFYDPADLADWNDPAESDGPCDRFFYDAPVQYDYDYLNGGTVTITGANVSPIHLTPSTYQYGWMYTPDYDYLGEDNLFDAGDAIHVATQGHGDIPAFAGDVGAPGPVQVTKPSNFDALTTLPSGAMTFSWNAGGAEWMSVMVSTYLNSRGQTIICRVPDADGTVTVPASLMADLYDAPDSTMVQLTRTAVTRGTADGKDCDFQALTYRQRGYFDY